MPDNLNTEFPDYIVKFPDVTVPKGYKVDKYPGYVPVKGFSKPGHHSKGETVRSDGMLPVQWPDPVVITLTPKLMARVNGICGRGLLKGEEIHCIHLARNDDDEHTESYETKLVGVSLEKQGDSVVVLYQKFTDKSHNGDDAPDEGGYDFLKQKKLD